jgi:inorganic pyrophosphatase
VKELEKFFQATDALEAKQLEFRGWRGPGQARKLINKLAR